MSALMTCIFFATIFVWSSLGHRPNLLLFIYYLLINDLIENIFTIIYCDFINLWFRYCNKKAV